MKKSEKYLRLYELLFAEYGECICPLRHDTPFQLLAAVMLSAQCRDERVNKVTAQLFALMPDAASMSNFDIDTIEKIIHPCGLSQSKSKNLLECAKMIIREYNGNVPQSMEELVRLPGIGRKSANVVLGNAFKIPGFPVDTHVKRLLNRIGVVKNIYPEEIEYDVNRNLPPELWTNFSHLLIQHGRAICSSRNPQCPKCVLSEICRKVAVKS